MSFSRYLYVTMSNYWFSLIEIADIQEKVKQTIDFVWKKALSNDWLEQKDAKVMTVIQHYTNLKWSKKFEGGLEDTEEGMKSVFNLLEIKGAGEKPMKILIEGIMLKCTAYVYCTNVELI